MAMISEQDFELLSAYVDGELSEAERAALEARLHAEADLRRELAALYLTLAMVKQLPTLSAPRNFTINAQGKPQTNVLPFAPPSVQYERRAAPRWWVIPATTGVSAVAAAAAAVMLVFGLMLMLNSGAPTASEVPLNQSVALGGTAVETLPSAPDATSAQERQFGTPLPSEGAIDMGDGAAGAGGGGGAGGAPDVAGGVPIQGDEDNVQQGAQPPQGTPAASTMPLPSTITLTPVIDGFTASGGEYSEEAASSMAADAETAQTPDGSTPAVMAAMAEESPAEVQGQQEDQAMRSASAEQDQAPETPTLITPTPVDVNTLNFYATETVTPLPAPMPEDRRQVSVDPGGVIGGALVIGGGLLLGVALMTTLARRRNEM